MGKTHLMWRVNQELGPNSASTAQAETLLALWRDRYLEVTIFECLSEHIFRLHRRTI
jgi:hypothetical protein